jgi:hypothetical protein
MALPDLHKFKDDLRQKPSHGSDAPPRTVRANDLDENFRKVTIIEPNDEPKSYSVEYTREGTRLKIQKGLPDGATFRQFDVCENGQPVQYWMATWNEEPS